MIVRAQKTWQLRTRSLHLGERTLVMAIVNLTPDSFSGDGTLRVRPRNESPHVEGVAAAMRALKAGADILDLGAESTRPDAVPLAPEQEQARLLPVLEALRKARPEALISVDTYHASTARLAAERGAEIINDVSGLAWDSEMTSAARDTGCGLVLMHTRGRPQEWRSQTALARGSVAEAVRADLAQQLARALSAGIVEGKVVLDPGFGFGKIGAENFELLAGLARLQELGRPVLIGLSRKGFLGEAVAALLPEGTPPAEARRTATQAATVAAVLAGAGIVRVHDVEMTRESVAVADALLAASSGVNESLSGEPDEGAGLP